MNNKSGTLYFRWLQAPKYRKPPAQSIEGIPILNNCQSRFCGHVPCIYQPDHEISSGHGTQSLKTHSTSYPIKGLSVYFENI